MVLAIRKRIGIRELRMPSFGRHGEVVVDVDVDVDV
jgi:hypothetical protein